MSNSTEKLQQVFVENIGVAPDTDWQNLAYGSSPGWDSVGHMALVSGIENTFDIMLTTDQVINMSDFGKAKEILSEHGIVFNAQG